MGHRDGNIGDCDGNMGDCDGNMGDKSHFITQTTKKPKKRVQKNRN